MKEKTFNGCTNYETWTTKLWLMSESGLFLSVQKFIESIKQETLDYDERISHLAEHLEDILYENYPNLCDDIYSDLLSSALRSVNYYEIAESLYTFIETLSVFQY